MYDVMLDNDGLFKEIKVIDSVGDSVEFKLSKSLEAKQYVFGWASVVRDKDGNIPFDWAGDVLDEADIEESAYNFVRNHRVTGLEHQGDAFGEMIESIMFTKEKQAVLGIPDGILPIGWFIGFYIENKDIYNKIINGELGMFSIQGKIWRVPLKN